MKSDDKMRYSSEDVEFSRDEEPLAVEFENFTEARGILYRISAGKLL